MHFKRKITDVFVFFHIRPIRETKTEQKRRQMETADGDGTWRRQMETAHGDGRWRHRWFLGDCIGENRKFSHNSGKRLRHPSFQNLPMHNFRSKLSFYWVFWRFRWFSDHFIFFLGIYDVTKGVQILKFSISDIIINCLYPKPKKLFKHVGI